MTKEKCQNGKKYEQDTVKMENEAKEHTRLKERKYNSRKYNG